MRRWALVFWVLVALWLSLGWIACLAGCRPQPSNATPPAPVVGRWPASAWPLELQASAALSPCQRAALQAAAVWWEHRSARSLFAISYVPADAIAVSGLPPFGVVGVSSGGMSGPCVLEDAHLTWAAEDRRLLYSVDLRLAGCSVRAAAHGLGHVLGLGHVDAPRALMRRVHDGDAWLVNEADVREVVPTGPL